MALITRQKSGSRTMGSAFLSTNRRIFGRFMRADNAQNAGISGTGLGLYLCRVLVEQHAGRLWFESGEGEGTTFFVTIPLVAPDRAT